MKALSIALLLPLLALLAPSCKKAEDDPALPFRTRKARVTGEWNVTTASGLSRTISADFGTTKSLPWNFDGTTFTTVDEFGYKREVPRTITFTFERDGTFERNDMIDGVPEVIRGEWNFNSGVGEEKKKSELVLFFTQTSSSNGTTLYSGYSSVMKLDIMELRNKKMVLHFVDNIQYFWGDKEDYNEEWILEQE